MRVLLVDTEHTLPHETGPLLKKAGWEVASVSTCSKATERIRAGDLDAVIVGAPARAEAPSSTARTLDGRPACPDEDVQRTPDGFDGLMRVLEGGNVATLLVGLPGAGQLGETTLIDYLPTPVGAHDLLARLSTISRYHRILRRMETELDNMQRLGKRLGQHFSEVDQEMRLASRLQRGFLPDVREPIDDVKFRTIYRPASWVSGDIYDVFRVDEEHVACYVADAVGHGMAASLLTIFIKQAIGAKQIVGDGYRILDPSETLANLNQALVAQSLPQAQFVTAGYMLLNTRTGILRYARGGHPYPLLFGADGSVTELKSPGGLLGIFEDDDYASAQVQLQPRDKVLLYTDGFELVFQDKDRPGAFNSRAYMKHFERLGRLPLDDMIHQIDTLLDRDFGSLNPHDDVSVVAFEVGPDS